MKHVVMAVESETLDEFRDVIDRQMRYYNRDRRHSGIGNQPPLPFLESEGIAA